MDAIELQMRCLEGKPIPLEPNLQIHKVSFSDVSDIDYIKYNRVINMLCLDRDKIIPFVKDDEIDVYTFLILNAYQSEKNRESLIEETFMDELLQVLTYIFNDTVTFDEKYGCFCVGMYGFLYHDNFEEFQSIIKKRNCLENIEVDKDDPANAMAKQLLEKRKKAREKVAKLKAQQNDEDGEPLTIIDLISIFAEAEHKQLEDIFKYDIYQFNNQFNRMKIFKDYEVNIQALLAGAKSDDINIQHWLSKIKTK